MKINGSEDVTGN